MSKGVGSSACGPPFDDRLWDWFVYVLKRILTVLAIAGFTTMAVNVAIARAGYPEIEQGVLDLRDWEFSDGRLTLSGDWQVVWESFVEPEDFFSYSSGEVISVPDDWGNDADAKRPFSKTGYATYGLRILMPPSHPELALDMGSHYYASRVFLGGKLVRQIGEPSPTAEGEKQSAWARPGILRIAATDEQQKDLDLVIHLSNHIHAHGGFRAAMGIGEAHYMIRGLTIDTMSRLMLIGAALLLAIYHIILFLNRRGELGFLSFSAFLLTIVIHGICSLPLMLNIAPQTSAAFMLHLEYLSIVLGSYSGVMFVWHLYPQTMWPAARKVLIGCVAGGVLFILATPPLIFTGFLAFIKAGVVVSLLIGLVSVLVAVRRRLDGARLLLVSMSIMAGGVVYGIVMHSLAGVALYGITYLCMSAMLLGQAAVLGRRVTSAINKSERLGLRLLQANEGLEEVVANRTKHLKIAVEDSQIALVDAHRANRAKSEFFALMSHEIRTPLNGLLGMASLLHDTRLDEDQMRFLTAIRQSGDDLLITLNDILDISKVEAGGLTLEEEDFDLGDLLQRCITLWEPRAKEKGLSLLLDLVVPEGLWLRGDRHRLLQVISNLVSNSIKFTKTGGVRIGGEVSQLQNGEIQLVLKVIDTGVGIPVSARDEIFRPFHQADLSTTREFGGTGLGLTICDQIIQLMGGTIDILDNEADGRGVAFEVTVCFPVGDVSFTTPDYSEGLPAESSEKLDHGSDVLNVEHSVPYRVLLADDHRINQMYVATSLKKLGHSCTVASNGVEALEALKHEQFDVVLMDIHMPELDGVGATRQIRRSNTGYADIPVIALTANAMPEQVETYLAAGMDDVLTKPVTIPDLMTAIQCILGHKSKSTGKPIDGAEIETALLVENSTKAPGLNALEVTPIVDQDYVENMVASLGADNVVRLLQPFTEDVIVILSDLRQAISDGEFDRARDIAHGLHGIAGNTGARRLQTLAKKMQLSEDSELKEPSIDDLETAFAGTQQWIKEFLIAL